MTLCHILTERRGWVNMDWFRHKISLNGLICRKTNAGECEQKCTGCVLMNNKKRMRLEERQHLFQWARGNKVCLIWDLRTVTICHPPGMGEGFGCSVNPDIYVYININIYIYIYIYIYIRACVCVCVFTNLSTRIGCETRPIFKQKLWSFNSVFLVLDWLPYQD